LKKHLLWKTVEQIELSVVTKQLAAIELYKGLAFQIYGEESRSLKVNGCYYDEFLMMKKIALKSTGYFFLGLIPICRVVA
jgi:ribosomal protein S18 acetylase RimI-like enzyme